MTDGLNRAAKAGAEVQQRLAEMPREALLGAPSRDALARALVDGRDGLRRAVEERAPIERVIRGYAGLADAIVRAILDSAVSELFRLPNPTTGERLAAIAIGGYGRGEMAPHSDVDLLFLHPYKRTPHTENLTEHTLYRLWDLGLKVGHAVRSVEDCVKAARGDATIETALLDRRLVWGSAELYDELDAKLSRAKEGRAAEFLEAKLEERDARHKRTGDSRYLLEPNVKEGKGGLRDLQGLMWIGAFVHDAKSLDDLVRVGALDASAAKIFADAKRFLWRVRCHLHLLANRPEEVLAFDRQAEIARRMRFRSTRAQAEVVRFMKRYYSVAKNVGDLTRIVLAGLEEQHNRAPGGRVSAGLRALGLGVRRFGPFVVQHGRVDLDELELFERRPIAMLELFHLAQRRGLDLHPRAFEAVARCAQWVRGDLRRDPEANALFLDMLTYPGDVAGTLRRMNEAGLLGRFVTEFGRVIGLPQHGLYHVYTVDEHTLRALAILREIETGAWSDELPISTREMPKLASRKLLFVATLLHDIGKGSGRDHSIVGEEIANRLCPRLGLDQAETETVAWLVRHHLIMSDTAFKRDIEDPKTIADFVALVQSPERLRLLLLLTVADIRAVGPKVWNGWKGQLLRELFFAAAATMSVGDAPKARAERIAAKVGALEDELARRGWDRERIARHIERNDPRYWLRFEVADLAHHAQAIGAAERDGAAQAIEIRAEPFLDRTELLIYTEAGKGVFVRVAGALAAAGMSIVDGHIHRTADGKALIVQGFQSTQDQEAIADKRSLARIKVAVANALAEEKNFDLSLRGRRSLPARAEKAFPVEPRVLIDNAASRESTVVEINGRDRPGLLYALGRALERAGVAIASAHVATYGERAVDVFYVRDRGGRKLVSRPVIERMERALFEVLDPR